MEHLVTLLGGMLFGWLARAYVASWRSPAARPVVAARPRWGETCGRTGC